MYWLIAVILFVVLIAAGYLLAAQVIYPRRFGYEKTYTIEVDNGRLDPAEWAAWEKEEIWLQSPFGYSLHGMFFPHGAAKKTVILSHGFTYTLFGSVKYMRIFRALGFNAFLYDNRYHGQSGGKNCTLGYYEKHDLETVTTWVQNRVGADGIIGTHGESMGAAISILHAAIDPRVQFVVEDCGYDRLDALLAYRSRADYRLPEFPFVNLANVVVRILTGMDFHRVAPVEGARQVTAPMLFIHGAEDDFVPVKMVHALYEQKVHGPRKLYIVPGAGHAQAYNVDPAGYARVIREFLAENGLDG
ncbi:MAG TPA: alpha/beta hydrolase [Anaerolineaceae bacterium]